MESSRERRIGIWCCLAALAAFVIAGTSCGVIDLDLYHEMALAREIVTLGYVPWTDSFAYTPTVDIVVHHEWGLGMIALLLASWTGGYGIIALKFALILGLGCVVWKTARRRRASPVVVSCVMVLAVILGDLGFTTVRAQMFSYLFAALLLAGFDRDRKGDRTWLVGVAILFPIWANIHGGCLVGAALFAMHWLEQVLRRQPHWHLFAMGLALIPLAAINPWGFHFHRYLIHAILMPRPAIAEWSPLWDPRNTRRMVVFCISLVPLLLTIRRIGLRQLPGILIVIATGFAAIKGIRFLPFYGIAYASYLSSPFSRMPFGRDLRRAWWKFQPLFCACLALIAFAYGRNAVLSQPWVLYVASHPLPDQGTHLIYPVGAVDHLQQHHFRGNAMIPYNWGSYVMWRLTPDVKVSYDSRYEVAYPVWRMEEELRLYDGGEGWKEILDKYPTDIILVRPQFKLTNLLKEDSDWKQVYSDPQFLMFARPNVDLPAVESDEPAANGKFP